MNKFFALAFAVLVLGGCQAQPMTEGGMNKPAMQKEMDHR